MAELAVIVAVAWACLLTWRERQARRRIEDLEYKIGWRK